MKLIFFVLLLAIAIPNASSFGKKEMEGGGLDSENTKTILGRVEIYGSEPRTFAAIIDENGNTYAVHPEKEAELRSLQGHLVEFTVIILEDVPNFEALMMGGLIVMPLSWRIIE